MALPHAPLVTPYLDPTVLQLQSNDFDRVDRETIRLVTHDQYRRLSNPQSLFFMWKLVYLFYSILHSDTTPFTLIEHPDHLSLSYRTSQFSQVLSFFDTCNLAIKQRNIESPISQQRADKRYTIHIFYLFKYLGFNAKSSNKTIISLSIPSLTDIQSLLASSSFAAFKAFLESYPFLLTSPLSRNFPALILNIDPFHASPLSFHSSPSTFSPIFASPEEDNCLAQSLSSDLATLQDTVDQFVEQHPLYPALHAHSYVFRCMPATSRRLFLTELLSFDFASFTQ